MTVLLRPYQESAIEHSLEYAAVHPTGRLVLVIPPRGGKTFVAAMLVKLMVIDHGLRALWLVHREELLDAAVEHLIECGIPAGSIGVIKAGRSSDPSAKIQVASDATLDRRNKPVAHLVVTDESHRDTAPRRRRIRRAYPKAFLIGITGTPVPPAGRDLGEDFDALHVVVQPSELIHDGFLSPPSIFAPERNAIPNLRGLKLVAGDYMASDLEALLLQQTLLDDAVREWKRLAEGRRTVAFPVSIAHSRALVDRFRAAGIRAYHLDGLTANDPVEPTPREPRTRGGIIEALRKGWIPIVCSPGVLSEGIDLPEVKCVLGARPTRSLALYIQQMMRCATPWAGVRPRVLDTVGNVYEHDYPHADRHWALSGPSGNPTNPKPLKRCPACGAIIAAALLKCAECAQPLERTSPEPMVPTRLDLHELSPHAIEIQRERERLLTYAAARGFADPDGWAERVLAAKHGGEAA